MGAIRGNSYYTIVDGPTWTAASSNAQSLGGSLAVIADANENQFITEYMGEQNIYNSAFIGFKGGKWVNGGQLSYNNFHPDIKSNQDYYFSNYPYSEIWAPSAEQIKKPWQVDIKPGVWNTAKNDQDGRNQRGIAEIPITSSASFSATPKEGEGVFTTTINLSAGNSSNLINGTEIFWKITGVTSDDLVSGSIQGSGTISNGKLEIQHALKEDSDTGEQFTVSAYSDSLFTQQIGTSKSSAIQEADPIPISVFSFNGATIEEGTSEDIKIIRSGDTSRHATVKVWTEAMAPDETATPGLDYYSPAEFIPGGGGGLELSFSPGETEKSFSLEAYEDHIEEEAENILVFGIHSDDPNYTVEYNSNQIWITDAPKASIFRVDGTTIREGHTGSVKITRSGEIERSEVIKVWTEAMAPDETATPGLDYYSPAEFIPGGGGGLKLSFSPGETEKSFSIQAFQDNITENPENLLIFLGGGSHEYQTHEKGSDHVWIVDPDPTPTPTPTPTHDSTSPSNEVTGENNNTISGNNNTITNVDNSTTNVDNSTSIIDNSTTIIDNSVTDNSTVNIDNSTTNIDNSINENTNIEINDSTTNIDNSETIVDNSIVNNFT